MDSSSMYPDEGASDTAPDSKPDRPESKKEKADSNTELVSKSFLNLDEDETAEEGHKCTIEIVKDWGDQVEVKYLKHDKKEKETPKEEMSAEEELDKMDTMKGKSYAGTGM